MFDFDMNLEKVVGDTIALRAIYRDYAQSIVSRIEHGHGIVGHDVDQFDTARDMAVRFTLENYKPEWAETLQLLLGGGDIIPPIPAGAETLDTALSICCEEYHKDALEIVVKHCVDFQHPFRPNRFLSIMDDTGDAFYEPLREGIKKQQEAKILSDAAYMKARLG